MARIRYTTPDQGTHTGWPVSVSLVGASCGQSVDSVARAPERVRRFSARLDEAIESANVEADAASAGQHAAAQETAAGEPVEDIKRHAQITCSASAVEEPRERSVQRTRGYLSPCAFGAWHRVHADLGGVDHGDVTIVVTSTMLPGPSGAPAEALASPR